MTDEGKELLTELREFREESDHLLNEIRSELTGLRADLGAGFRQMDAGFKRMNDRLAVLPEKVEVLQQRVTDPSSPLHRRRKLG